MKLMGKNSAQVYQTLSNFQFSAVDLTSLGGSEYTIVQILVDVSGSVQAYKKDLEKTIGTVIEACKQSPRSSNLLLRVAMFKSSYKNGVEEIHGFNQVTALDATHYQGCLKPDGCTPLFDACLNALESLDVFGQSLANQGYLVNGIFFVITDGYENASKQKDIGVIRATVKKIRTEEKLESIRTVLIGLADDSIQQELRDLHTLAGFDEYLSIGKVSADKLKKLAQFVSMSISMTSQALSLGSPVKSIGFRL
jgi:hypothetical protein